MKLFSRNLLPVMLAVAATCFFPAARAQRSVRNFDKAWKFIKEDVKGAEATAFADGAWRLQDVPHDWSLEYPFSRSNPAGRGGGYVESGIGWYRKSFTLLPGDDKKRVFIEFDGVMANSDVWINGFHLGKRPSGYLGFEYELTGHLNVGKDQPNVLAVRADNSVQPSSRWYTGAGIYRHVRLIVTDPVHLAHWGTNISTKVNGANATVHVISTVYNQSAAKADIVIETNVIDPAGKAQKMIATKVQVAAGATLPVAVDIPVVATQLWNLDQPNLYQLVTKVRSGKGVADENITSFGIRDFKFEPATGFWLNGTNIKIKGVCLHHDGGAVGAAVPLRVYERRLQLLKKIGVNGIRTSHNAPAPEFLDLCDKLGFVVMDETFDTWNSKKSNAERGYNLYFDEWWERDTRDMVLRDLNHPSIFIYSVGNEIHDNLNDSAGFHKYKMQQDLIHALDPGRPVTMALFRPGISKVYDNGFANMMDVVGQNYRENELVVAHEKNPERKVIGTENGHTQAAWLALRDKPFMSGQFLWTGFDYLGEADWPELVNGQGLYDRTGGTRNLTYQRESWWSNKPVLFVMRKEKNAGEGTWISDWSPTDIDTYDQAAIQAYSNCDEIELFLNGKSIGVKQRPTDKASAFTFTTTFEKGTLKAVGKIKGEVVATQELTTAGAPAKIMLTVDKAAIGNNWDDLAYVTAVVTDEQGNSCLNADQQISFTASGAGIISGTDNGDLSSTESYLSSKHFVFRGTCVALVKANAANGKITVKASASGLKDGVIELQVK